MSFALPRCESLNYDNCFGSYTSPNGDNYVGEFRDGTYNGQGTYTKANGDKYVGEFRDGKKHGQGTYSAPNGEKYIGEFRDDLAHGQGTYTAPNGIKYVGEFRYNKKHGQGTYTYADGRVEKGIWKDDEFQYAQNPMLPEPPKVAVVARIAKLTPTEICTKAININSADWDVRDEWKPYTDEAKRRGLTCEDRKAEVRQQLAAAGAERDRKTKAKRQADLHALQTNPTSVALAEEVALSLPFEVSLVPQMNDLMLCVQGKFRKNDVLSSEISKRGIRCDKLLELMR